MDYKLSISKDEINTLPLYQFEGSITLIESADDALRAIDALKNETILGFDTETRAALKKVRVIMFHSYNWPLTLMPIFSD